MLDLLFSRLGFVGLVIIIALAVWVGCKLVVAWRDTNGNGQIDLGE